MPGRRPFPPFFLCKMSMNGRLSASHNGIIPHLNGKANKKKCFRAETLRAQRRTGIYDVNGCIAMTCGLAWNPLTENVRGGRLTIKTMTTATNRMAVSSALDHDATMGKPEGKPDTAKAGLESGEMERITDAVESIKRHEK